MADRIKLAVAILLVIAGVFGYYLLVDQPPVLRVMSVLLGVIAGAAVASLTVPGKQFYVFSQESISEARKVVWPTRKESLQMTAVVFAFVLVMAVFLWVIDASLLFVVQRVIGGAG